MFIEELSLENYRSFKKGHFSFTSNRTVICGENGKGKSNLLESIYFFAVAKSNRSSPERDVVRNGENYFQIQAGLTRGSHAFKVRIYYDQQTGKRIFLDGAPLSRLSDLLGTFNAVLFSPEDVDLVLRFPHERRRMLDMLASQASVSYLADLQTYQRALTQRNRILKNGLSSASAEGQLFPWDQQLAEAGARLVRFRREAVRAVGPQAGEFYASFSPHGEDLRVRYESPLGEGEVGLIGTSLLRLLAVARDREMRLGHTTVGPHKDQLLFEIAGRDIQRHASKGQMKCVLLSWKLAEAGFLQGLSKEMPVLLLDDIFSEIDANRSACLLDLLPGFGQVILTTARDPDPRMGDYQRIQV